MTLLSLLLAPVALARDGRDRDWGWDHCRRECVSAPEIDPGQAMGALALLSGTVAILRGYRSRKKRSKQEEE